MPPERQAEMVRARAEKRRQPQFQPRDLYPTTTDRGRGVSKLVLI